MAKIPDYKHAVAYWSSQPTTVDGMLGGYGTGRVPRLDVQHSTLFLRQLIASGQLLARLPEPKSSSSTAAITTTDPSQPISESENLRDLQQKTTTTSDAPSSSSSLPVVLPAAAAIQETTHETIRAVDCGAGIGRLTSSLLLNFADLVDLVEPCAPFCTQIRTSQLLSQARADQAIGTVFECGLQHFEPSPNTYQIIWNQWCLGQLSDVDLIAYIKRCRPALKQNGLIFVKENVASDAGDDIFDELDSSYTRTEASFMRIFKESGVRVVKSSVQHGFPKKLFKVKVWALR